MAIGKQMEKEHATHVRRLERARDQALSNNAGHAEELESRDSEIARLKAELEIKNREVGVLLAVFVFALRCIDRLNCSV